MYGFLYSYLLYGIYKVNYYGSWLRYNMVYNIINFLTNSTSKYAKFNSETYILSYIGFR
jgi:hypothetical protein